MIERHLHFVRTDAAGLETPAATRERLRGNFPRGATRRMSQLGLLLGSALADCAPCENDTLVYASAYAESRALEEFLASFPAASPTLFQTSIHPSAVQQVLVNRQRPVREFFPHTGCSQLVAQAVQTAMLAPSPRAILCGGEERGTWLLDWGIASAESFAFAIVLSRDRAGALATLSLDATGDEDGELTLRWLFSALHGRLPLDQRAAPGLSLSLAWH
jgi:hypothetical protein